MKYRINYYAERKLMHNRIHIMDPRITGTKILNDQKEEEDNNTQKTGIETQFIVPWQQIG